jgi:hypothetical protein
VRVSGEKQRSFTSSASTQHDMVGIGVDFYGLSTAAHLRGKTPRCSTAASQKAKWVLIQRPHHLRTGDPIVPMAWQADRSVQDCSYAPSVMRACKANDREDGWAQMSYSGCLASAAIYSTG